MSSAMLVLMVGLGLGGPQPISADPWLSDYGIALRQTAERGRPLLVVLDDHDESSQVHLAAHAPQQIPADLLDDYTLCHVDVSTAYGKRVAQAFKAQSFPRTVIIDRSGSVQLFKHTGQLSQEAFRATLAKYRRGDRPTASAPRYQSFPSGGPSMSPANCFT